ncbi:unnamed protein product [Alopecurus aequalis]
MPRRKIALRPIENARARATTYAKRTKGLQKKALELATLYAVPVALVCAAGAGAPLGWESEEGVLEKYRATAVPQDTRVRHTHRSYLKNELGKERAKLARARPGALPDWDPALDDMTQDEAREVLQTIAGDKMAALGLPAAAQLKLDQVALTPNDSASDDASGVLAPQHLSLVDMDMGACLQPQLMPCYGGSNDHGGLLGQFLMQPGNSLKGGGSYSVGAFDETQASGGYGDNADCRWPDLTMCYESWDAVMPVGYYTDFTDGALALDLALPLEYPMGMDENFGCLDMDNSYTTHGQAEGFQGSGTSTGHYQYQWSDPGTCSSNQAFHYQYQY